MTPGLPPDPLVQGKRWMWFALFVVVLALLGGSSRPDPVQNAALRPIAALLLIPALVRLRAADISEARTLLALGGALMVWMVVQICPLPPGLWQALPGRDMVAALDRLTGMDGIWRPISLAPFRGLNAVLAMLVPLIALLLVLTARVPTRAILLAITGMAAVNAVLGILQVVGGPRSPFYLFAMTNRGAPTGLFANENHAAVFAAIALLVIARLAAAGRSAGLPGWGRLALAPVYVLILLGVLIGGSRAGLAATLLAVGAGGTMMWTEMRAPTHSGAAATKSARSMRRRGLALLAAGGAGACLVVAVFVLLGRAPAASDLLASGATIEDLRWSLWPVLWTMVRDHWLVGTGFGSFDAVYRSYEPTALMLPVYINQAHNDWAQLVIEGGLPATACALGLIGWMGIAILQIARRSAATRGSVIFWTTWLAILMAASLVDYPLRTPIFQAVSIWLLVGLARERVASARQTEQSGEIGWQRAKKH